MLREEIFWVVLSSLLSPAWHCTHGYFPKPLPHPYACIFLALPWWHHTRAGRAELQMHNGYWKSCFCFHFLHLPKGFCKTPNYAATHFVFSLAELPISCLSNKFKYVGVRPGSESWLLTLCHTLWDPRQVTSPLWASFPSFGQWGLTQCLTSSSVNDGIMWSWLLFKHSLEDKVKEEIKN